MPIFCAPEPCLLYAPGSPSLQFNPVVCEVVFAKNGGIADVRRLFR